MKKLKTKLTNLIILDASGSMQTKQTEVVGGLKQLLEQIQADASKDQKTVQTATIVTDFSSPGDFNVLINTKVSTDLNPDSADKYTTRGMTALYDAIRKSFDLVDDKQDSVFVTIFTDGEENASQEMKHEAIKSLIKEKKAKNWVITFMGTTEADIENAVALGVSRGNTMSFMNDADGVKKSFSKLSSVRTAYYASNTSSNKADMDNLMEDDKS